MNCSNTGTIIISLASPAVCSVFPVSWLVLEHCGLLLWTFGSFVVVLFGRRSLVGPLGSILCLAGWGSTRQLCWLVITQLVLAGMWVWGSWARSGCVPMRCVLVRSGWFPNPLRGVVVCFVVVVAAECWLVLRFITSGPDFSVFHFLLVVVRWVVVLLVVHWVSLLVWFRLGMLLLCWRCCLIWSMCRVEL